MNAETVIAEIETLPAAERAKVFACVNHAVAEDRSWIPESFRQAIADAGRLTDVEIVLRGSPPHVSRNWRRGIS